MPPEFAQTLEAKLRAYRTYAAAASIRTCRLVHYCGVDRPSSIDVPLDQIEDEISGCICDGFFVDWLCRDDRLFLCIQEPGCPIPEWSRVIAEAAIQDVDEIMRRAGLKPKNEGA